MCFFLFSDIFIIEAIIQNFGKNAVFDLFCHYHMMHSVYRTLILYFSQMYDMYLIGEVSQNICLINEQQQQAKVNLK